ncbi:unnamed protein product [Caenorhabditis brenneri]
MLCFLTASFTAVYIIFLNIQLFFEAINVLFNGRNGDILLSMLKEYFAAWLIVGVVKMMIWTIHKCRKPGSYYQSRNEVLLGLALIAFFAILGKTLIGMNYENQSNAATYVCFPVNGFFASYFLLVHLPSRNFNWNTKPGSRVYQILLVILVFIHAGSFIKTIMDGFGYKHPTFFLVLQFCYSLICASSTADILAILTGRLEEKSEKLRQRASGGEMEGGVEQRPSMLTIELSLNNSHSNHYST